MKTSLDTNEALLRSGGANLQRGAETVGGWLYLTDRRLIFESHAFNLQTGTTAIFLGEITTVAKCWTRFLNKLPLFPNSLAVTTDRGREHRLVLFRRSAWLAAIIQARAACLARGASTTTT